MKYKFEITKRLLGYNEYNNLNRKNRYSGNTDKRTENRDRKFKRKDKKW